MTENSTLAHLAGYAAIVVVMSSASWSGILGSILGALFVVAVLVLFGFTAVDRIGHRLRAEAEDAARESATATDGGHREGSR